MRRCGRSYLSIALGWVSVWIRRIPCPGYFSQRHLWAFIPQSKIQNPKSKIGCGGVEATTAVAHAGGAKVAGQWQRVVEAAKKEGQVVVYIGGYEAVLPDFEKDYPEIKLVAVPARGAQIVQRLISERRGEKYLADVVSTGANATYQQLYPAKVLDPIKAALILPEITDPSKWYEGKHQYADAEGQYVFNYVGSATYGSVNYNTKLGRPEGF